MFSAHDLRRSLAALTPAKARGQVLAISGGADSLALAAAAVALRDADGGLPLRAVHVDHGMQEAAKRFRVACERACAALRLPLTILPVRGAPTPGRSLEEWAREARYAVLAADLRPDECLLTAHQMEDQAETFLLQALRGAGLAGLAAMPSRAAFGAGWHLRPLLSVPRQALREYLARRGLEVVEDDMNADQRFDRAFLRQTVWPVLSRRWPAAAEVLARSAVHVADAQRQRQQEVQRELQRARDGDALSLPALRRLPEACQRDVLRAFIEASGARAPSHARLVEGLRQMLQARADAAPAVRWEGHALRRHRERVHLTAATLPALDAGDWCWREAPVLQLGAGMGSLRLEPRRGGLDPARLADVLRIEPLGYSPGRGAQRLRLERSGPTRALRNLMQEAGVVPWWRDHLPMLYSEGALVAVAHLWRPAGWCVEPDAMGLAVLWSDGPTLY